MGRLSKAIFFIGVIYALSPERTPSTWLGEHNSAIPSPQETVRQLEQVSRALKQQHNVTSQSNDTRSILESITMLLSNMPNNLWGSSPSTVTHQRNTNTEKNKP
jgi:hypothetical protein